MKTILVTGIGGNVAQGIARNIRAMKQDIRIVGTNTELVSSGNYLCDRVYKVPFGTHAQYIPSIARIVKKEGVDLILPSTDYEAVALSGAREKLPLVVTSDHAVNHICLDKFETFVFCRKKGIPFARTALPGAYRGEFDQIVLKPREGRGSRGVIISPSDWKVFTDTFIVQERLFGTEITVSFYVTKKGEALGNITMVRKLYSGFTSRCIVSFDYEKKVKKLIVDLTSALQIRGSFNIQAMATESGEVIPFEFNSRISGTNSIRSHFGFPDVQWAVEEYLFDVPPKAPKITPGGAIRVIADIIYPGIATLEQTQNSDFFIAV
jgi:carbamoyl-phosphate synthase large subunit